MRGNLMGGTIIALLSLCMLSGVTGCEKTYTFVEAIVGEEGCEALAMEGVLNLSGINDFDIWAESCFNPGQEVNESGVRILAAPSFELEGIKGDHYEGFMDEMEEYYALRDKEDGSIFGFPGTDIGLAWGVQKTSPIRPLEGGYDVMTVSIYADPIQEEVILSTGYGWIWVDGVEFFGYLLSSGRDDIPVGIEGTCTAMKDSAVWIDVPEMYLTLHGTVGPEEDFIMASGVRQQVWGRMETYWFLAQNREEMAPVAPHDYRYYTFYQELDAGLAAVRAGTLTIFENGRFMANDEDGRLVIGETIESGNLLFFLPDHGDYGYYYGVRSPLSNVIVTGKLREEQHVAFSIALN